MLDHEGEEADFLDLLLLYYLFLEHAGMTGDFTEIVRWVPGLTRQQRRRILSWPEEYVFSLFEVKSRKEKLTYKDVRTNKVYQIDAAVSGIDLTADDREKTTVLALIVPMEKDYLSTPPFIYPLNVFAIEQIKKIEDYLFDPEELLSDYYYCSKHKDIPVGHTLFHPNSHTNPRVTLRNEGPRETDPKIAKLLIDQHDFFREFEHREQAEKLLTKIIEKFPRMFYPYPDNSELMEAFRLLFTSSNELTSSQDEEVTYWYEAICEKLNEEVKAIEPYTTSITSSDTSLQ
ncbi:hypothetical protein JZO70_20745 [Enterococcus sp. 669A]|uniref:Uncharacterized protein n=1 Tax=Candidatus Enterococcus moelleringii TaxID=2815325 RepID=A0ABS3LG59_9ENTE|nr:hypothetical protein [Enterococcus sp. 669A]MBO1308615.1 hypothetical protein [Enterococcus sp. 669A]